jgi:hypothetical protein
MSVWISTRAALLSVAAFALLLLAGCGSSSSASSTPGNGVSAKTPDQIVEAAKAAAAAAVSAHVAGSIVSEGKPISIDMELLAGKGGKGEIKLEGLSVQIVEVDKAVYMNGSEAFYAHLAGTEAAKLLQGKWLKAPTSSGDFASFSSLTDLKKLVGGTLAAHGKLKAAGSATVEGQPAVGVTDSGAEGTLYVASTGTPYPLEIVKHGASGGKVVFNRWNKPVTLTPPANWININRLKSGH